MTGTAAAEEGNGTLKDQQEADQIVSQTQVPGHSDEDQYVN